MEKKRWSRLVSPEAGFHLARVGFLPSRHSRLHTHDFPEVFWLEAGDGIHEINGEEKKLFSGDVVFVRASDRHRLRAANAPGFTLVNLAFPAALLASLSARHPEIATLHGTTPGLPVRRRLVAVQLQQLKADLARLTTGGAVAMRLEKFLLGLYLMALPTPAQPVPALPDWLEKACAALATPAHLAEGVPALVRLSNRSAEHVARVCRQQLDVSPTEFVNRLRMDHAARELRLGSKPILEICLDCGLNNLAHFYTLFRDAHGQTPRRYRLAHQQTAT